MAKNRRYTDRAIIDALEKHRGLVSFAAREIGCHPDTIYERSKTCDGILKAMEQERAKIVDLAEHKLYQAVEADKPWAILKVLDCLGRRRGYSDSEAFKALLTEFHEFRTEMRAAMKANAPHVKSAGEGTGIPQE